MAFEDSAVPALCVTALIEGDEFVLEGVDSAQYWNLRRTAREVRVYSKDRELTALEVLAAFGDHREVLHRVRPRRARASNLRRSYDPYAGISASFIAMLQSDPGKLSDVGAQYMRSYLREAAFARSILPPRQIP